MPVRTWEVIKSRLEIKAVRALEHSPNTSVPVAGWTQPCPHHPGPAPRSSEPPGFPCGPSVLTELLQPNPRDVRSPLLPFSAHQESCERVNIPPLLAARLNRGNRIPAPSPGVFHPCQHLLLMLCLAYCIYLLDGFGGFRERSKDMSHCPTVRGWAPRCCWQAMPGHFTVNSSKTVDPQVHSWLGCREQTDIRMREQQPHQPLPEPWVCSATTKSTHKLPVPCWDSFSVCFCHFSNPAV